MTARVRPLSPHLDIYRWQMGNTLSILHRLTGIALALGFPVLGYWLIAVSQGEDAYRKAAHAFSSPFGELMQLVMSFAFFYHLLNGVRHLCWDMGLGFDRPARRVSGWVSVGGAVALTLGLWTWLWVGERL